MGEGKKWDGCKISIQKTAGYLANSKCKHMQGKKNLHLPQFVTRIFLYFAWFSYNSLTSPYDNSFQSWPNAWGKFLQYLYEEDSQVCKVLLGRFQIQLPSTKIRIYTIRHIFISIMLSKQVWTFISHKVIISKQYPTMGQKVCLAEQNPFFKIWIFQQHKWFSIKHILITCQSFPLLTTIYNENHRIRTTFWTFSLIFKKVSTLTYMHHFVDPFNLLHYYFWYLQWTFLRVITISALYWTIKTHD